MQSASILKSIFDFRIFIPNLHIGMNHFNSFDRRIRLELGIGSQLLRYCFEERSHKFSNVHLKVVVNFSNSLVELLHFLPQQKLPSWRKSARK